MTYSIFAAAASPVFTAGVSSTADAVGFGGIRLAPAFLSFSSKFSSSFARSHVLSFQSLRIPLGFVKNRQHAPGVAFATAATEKSVHNFTVKDIDGNDVSLSKFKGKILLIVNVASKCGLTTSNYTELSHLYEKYKNQDPKGIHEQLAVSGTHMTIH